VVADDPIPKADDPCRRPIPLKSTASIESSQLLEELDRQREWIDALQAEAAMSWEGKRPLMTCN
jgi:hypothetical protein